MFETNRIPEGWEKRINILDEVWVPTQFSKDIFISAGVIENKIKIIGEPVDTTFYSPQINNNEIILDNQGNRNNRNLNKLFELDNYIKDSSAFCFLFVGKWEDRKGVKILLRAYFNEFSNEDNVILTILTNSYHSTNDFQGEINKFLKLEDIKQTVKIMLISNIPQLLMPKLYSIANVLVIPSHGGKFGLFFIILFKIVINLFFQYRRLGKTSCRSNVM